MIKEDPTLIRCARLAALVLLLATGPAVAGDRPEVRAGGRIVVLDDFASGLDAWTAENAAVGIVTDELTARPALEWTLGDVGARLVYKHLDRVEDFGRYNRIRLRVRGWDGEGRVGVGCAVRASLNIAGWPRHPAERTPQWGLYDRAAQAGRDWRVLEERLDFPDWYPWAKTDNRKRGLWISAGAGFSSPSLLRIDEIVLIDDVVDMRGEWGRMMRLPDGGARWDYDIALSNRTAQPQTIAAQAVEPKLNAFAAEVPEEPLALAPGAEAVLRVAVRIPAAAVSSAAALYHEDLFLRLTPQSLPESAMTLRLPATVPLKLPPRPFLWKTAEQWEQARAEFAALEDAAKAKRLQTADAWVEGPVELPPPYDRARSVPLVDGTELHPHPLHWKPAEDADAGRVSHRDLFRAVQALGEAYQLTQDLRYARKAAGIVKAYADALDKYPLRGITEASEKGWARFAINNLHEGWLLMPLCYGYDMICDVPGVLTEDERRAIGANFFVPMGRVETLITSWHSNMTSVRNMAAVLCGFNADDSSLVHYGVFGHSGLQRAIDASINPDGFLTEIPMNYHWANLKEKLRLGVILRNTGMHIPYRRDLLEKACRVPYLRAFPNGLVTGFGPHGYGQGPAYGAGEYRAAAELFDDPLFSELADAARGREIIAGLDSVRFPHSELIVLRQRREADGDPHAVSFLFGNKRRAHGASLAFTWFGQGRILAPALGSLYNVTPLMEEPWTSPFYCQVNVDDLHQVDSTGELVFYRLGDGPQIASARADEIFPGVRVERTLALHDGMLFVADRLRSPDEHDYQWAYLSMGDLTTQGRFEGEPIEYAHGRQALSGKTTDADWQARWARPDLTLTAWMIGAPGTQVLSGDSYIAPAGERWRTPLLLARRRARDTLFMAVLCPHADRFGIAEVRQEPLDAPAAAAAAMRVTTRDGVEHVFVVNYEEVPLSGRGWQTAERAAVCTTSRTAAQPGE